MAQEELMASANEFLHLLSQNPYPGRGLIVGLDESGKNMVQVYWIMGRSESSRNRRFERNNGGQVRTVPIDSAKIKDPELTIYTAMDEMMQGIYVVSNGNQTDTIINKGYFPAMGEIQYEPDPPNFTPRISAICYSFKEQAFALMTIHRKMPNEDYEGYFTSYEKRLEVPEIGYCLTTYKGDGNPLPPFEGHPYPLPLRDSIVDILDTYWTTLNQENIVSLAVKFIPIDGKPSTVLIKNRYDPLLDT